MSDRKTQLPQELTKIGLSLGAIPVLVLTIATENAVKSLIEIGQAAEEVFRGDLLPILHVPEPKKDPETE